MRKGLQDWRRMPTSAATATLLNVLARRWALRVIWELRAAALNFRALQAACGHISPSVLQARLHELQQLGVIEKIPRLGYRLSGGGEGLYQCLQGLGDWAEAHASDLQYSNKLHNKN
jgi:DNA-binding HxlR family transcriptional regulator